MNKWFLIDNFSQKILEFKTKKALLEYCKGRGYRAKKCFNSNHLCMDCKSQFFVNYIKLGG